MAIDEMNQEVNSKQSATNMLDSLDLDINPLDISSRNTRKTFAGRAASDRGRLTTIQSMDCKAQLAARPYKQFLYDDL